MHYSTKTLSAGDHAPLFNLPNQTNERIILRDLAGQPVLLFFYASDQIMGCREVCLAFKEVWPKFNNLNIHIAGICLDSVESRLQFATQEDITFPLLSDTDQEVSQKYGVISEVISSNQPHFTYQRTAFLLDSNLRIFKIYNLSELSNSINQILKDIEYVLPKETPRHITQQAPILLIPNVLDPDFCKNLIQLWHSEGNVESGSMRRIGDKTIGVINYNHKIRRDHFISNEALMRRLDITMKRRVFPEIKKAFCFDITRREDYRIGCYDSSQGGFFRPHRDNTTGGTAHRRFAMSLNLNGDEYEGGYLRFPEYGGHLYKPKIGSAVIFSCSLLHEATDVTAGVRFVLLSFLYGEKEAEQRYAYESRVANDYNSVLRLTS
jgi:peroxiredoxin